MAEPPVVDNDRQVLIVEPAQTRHVLGADRTYIAAV